MRPPPCLYADTITSQSLGAPIASREKSRYAGLKKLDVAVVETALLSLISRGTSTQKDTTAKPAALRPCTYACHILGLFRALKKLDLYPPTAIPDCEQYEIHY